VTTKDFERLKKMEIIIDILHFLYYITHVIYLTLLSKATYNPVTFTHRRHSYREPLRVKCLAQGHID